MSRMSGWDLNSIYLVLFEFILELMINLKNYTLNPCNLQEEIKLMNEKSLIVKRSQLITPDYYKMNIKIPVGNKYVEFKVKKEYIGLKAGMLAFTKRTGSKIHTIKLKKKIRKR